MPPQSLKAGTWGHDGFQSRTLRLPFWADFQGKHVKLQGEGVIFMGKKTKIGTKLPVLFQELGQYDMVKFITGGGATE